MIAAPPPADASRHPPAWRAIDWIVSVPFLAMHVGAVAGLFIVPFTGKGLVLSLAMYFAMMSAVTIGYQRYFSHRSFKTSRAFQFVLALLCQMSAQKGVLWWAANHRHHHRYSDKAEDLHSPTLRGFWWSHVGWILARDYAETKLDLVKDLAKYRELRWLNRWHLAPSLTLAGTLYLLGGLPWVAWGWCVSTVLCWHVTFMINSLTHMFGRKRYVTKDDSRNSLILALLTFGEGWHNNHHYYQSSTRQGFFWWEIDLSYYALRALSLVGLVWDLREPPAHVVVGNRIAA
jgi:stearoyl-CoA desaturase (delta-9 desaturase)